MTDLTSRITEALDQAERLARGATPGPWRWGDWRCTFGTLEQERNTLESAPDFGPFPQVRVRDIDSERVLGTDDEIRPEDADFIAANNPASALRSVAADRRVLERHRGYIIPRGYPAAGSPNCNRCNGIEWPCEEIADLADRWGVEVPSD